MADREELAWAGGLFEGEGSFHEQRTGRNGLYNQVCASIGMADEDVIRRFHEIVGVGKVTGPHGPYGDRRAYHAPMWRWRASSFEGTQAIAAMLWGWLGVRRRARIREALTADRARTHHRARQRRNTSG